LAIALPLSCCDPQYGQKVTFPPNGFPHDKHSRREFKCPPSTYNFRNFETKDASKDRSG
jgi:hypothetical protein